MLGYEGYNLPMKFANLAQILEEDCFIDPEKSVTLGFSGGPDSLALLHALHREGVQVLVAHLDHALRPESAQEALQAEAVAANYSYPFFTERADVTGYARQHSMSVEEAARELRYEFLFRVATGHGAQAVAVAHNADDQVETVLMHLLRGAGSRGLRGMSVRSLPNPWSDAIPLIRPLLGFWRQEILDYGQAHGLQPILDQSNLDTTYFRNRLRHELLPLLEKFSPGVKGRLHQTAELLAAEAAIIDAQAELAWMRCLRHHAENFIQLDRRVFMDEPLASQRLLLRRAAKTLRPSLRNLDYTAIQHALELLGHPTTAPQDWLAGLCLLVEGDHLWIADWDSDLPAEWPQSPAQDIHLEVPAALELNLGWRLKMDQTRLGRRNARDNQDPFQAILDQDRVGDELVLRRRRSGDRFQPLGMESGSQKLSDFMINERLPKRARESWPLLCKGGEIVWVPGFQLAHPYRWREDSRRALLVRLSRSNGRGN